MLLLLVVVSHPWDKNGKGGDWICRAAADEQDACWEKRGRSRVRRLPRPADDAGVGRPGSGGRTGSGGGVPDSLQLPGEHGGLPRPGDPLRTQKHPQRDREAVSTHTLTMCVCSCVCILLRTRRIDEGNPSE